MATAKAKNADILAALKSLGLDPKIIDSISAVGNQHGEFKNRVLSVLKGSVGGEAAGFFSRAENVANWKPDPKKSATDNFIDSLKAHGLQNSDFIAIDKQVQEEMKKPGIRATKDGKGVAGEIDYINAAAKVLGGVSPVLLSSLERTGQTYRPPVWDPGPAKPAPAAAPAPAPAAAAPTAATPQSTKKGPLAGPGVAGPAAGGGGPGAGAIAPPGRGAGDVDTYIAQNYGHLAYLTSIPEIANIVKQAEKQGWDDDRIEGAITGSQWWKHTNDTQRTFADQKMTDPATAAKSLNTAVGNLRNRAEALGITISDAKLQQMAENSLSMGWQQSDVDKAIAAEFHYQKGQQGGDPAIVGQLKAMAGDFYIPMSDDAINQWGQQVIAGGGDQTQFKNYVKEQAKSMFPTISGAIDRGVTVKTFTDPYRQIASSTLEVPPDQIDFSDPKYLAALNQPDPKTGDNRMMSLSEWSDHIKKDTRYGWDKTQNAVDEATGLAQKLTKVFGGGL